MSETIQVPAYLITRTGEEASQRFIDWIIATKKKLLGAFPPAERAFCRILDKLKSRLPSKWRTRFHYTRQKHFMVSPSVVFFGDFYFGNIRLLIEIDGASHSGEASREKDEWRTRIIADWKVTTARILNATVLSGDFRDVERWIIDQFQASLPRSMAWRLERDYQRLRHQFPSVYGCAEPMTTWRKKK